MGDINSYANDLLVEFLDACHDKISSQLELAFGDDWLIDGVERHLHRDAFCRVREMLNSPMAVVDMEKADDELYGVEHLSKIVIGNWSIFGDAFGNRSRTEVYFGEIAELRHNVSHRRQRHMLRRSELLRFARNAQMLLSALRSQVANKFDGIAVSLEQGGSPWGNELGGTLPPATEIVPEFVGRESEIRELSIWFTSNSSPQYVIWGYGGSGKSALAYQFARGVRDGAPSNLQAVLWLSAKSREYIEGETRTRRADFDSVESFAHGLWAGLYDDVPSPDQATREGILRELSETPSMVVIDDLDSVLDNEDLTHLLLFEVSRTQSKFIYTSRQRIPGLPTIEVGGFSDVELGSYIRSRASEYDLVVEECLDRLDAISSVTDAFPLFVDDLLRYALLDGLKNAINDWSQRKGDAAREYALRRQLLSLGEAAQRALIGVAVASRPVTSLELANISGFTDDDVQHAIRDLLNWRLLNPQPADATGRPTFSCNGNTRRLTQKTYGSDPRYRTYQASFKTLSGSPQPASLRRTVGSAISGARALVLRGDLDGAEEVLDTAKAGELENNADLWGASGWVLSRRKDAESVTKARLAFQQSHELGSRKEDTYFHWAGLEVDVAEGLIDRADDESILELWREAARVAELGIERCGRTPLLCQAAAYLRTREAKTLERLMQFMSAQNCFSQGVEWARRSLSVPNTSSREVDRRLLFRTLVVALEGAGDPEATVDALLEWLSVVGGEDYEWQREHDRLASYPDYREVLASRMNRGVF